MLFRFLPFRQQNEIDLLVIKKQKTDEIALHCPWRIDRFFVFQRSLCLFSYCGSRIARLRDGSTRALS